MHHDSKKRLILGIGILILVDLHSPREVLQGGGLGKAAAPGKCLNDQTIECRLNESTLKRMIEENSKSQNTGNQKIMLSECVSSIMSSTRRRGETIKYRYLWRIEGNVKWKLKLGVKTDDQRGGDFDACQH